MLSENAAAEAEALLWDHFAAGTLLPALPERLRPTTRAEGYAIQARLERRSARPLFGWKIAATSLAGQRHIGVDGPLAGRLLAERVRADGATLEFGANHMRVVEPEFAFRLNRTLAPRDSKRPVDEVLAAVDTLHPALEIPDSRFADFASVGAAQLIADDACAREFVLGPAAAAPWRSLDLVAHRVEATVAGKLAREGRGENVLGDPRVALAWLANELSALGIPLAAGQVVTTGTCAAPLPVAPGDSVRADFGALGAVSLRFAAA
jgi:2-keto-4-pentenoate hydratase